MSKELAIKQDINHVAIKQDINKQHDLSVIEQVVMQGDLSKLSPQQRVTYYHRVCESMGLNPYTRPFDYISLNGKLTLYAKKDATEQLRKVNKVSIVELDGKLVDDLYIVKAKATTPDGRIDQATGAVVIGHLKGEQKANSIMKAETKAKRRVTLSISGMGWTDESEIESIPNAKTITVDVETGEIQEPVPPAITNQPEALAEPAKKPELVPEPGFNEFSEKHQLIFDSENKPASKKMEYILATASKSKKHPVQIINFAIQNEKGFLETFDKWNEKQAVQDVSITM